MLYGPEHLPQTPNRTAILTVDIKLDKSATFRKMAGMQLCDYTSGKFTL